MSDNPRSGDDRFDWTRRGWLSAASTGMIGAAVAGRAARTLELSRGFDQEAPCGPLPLPLTEFEPKSMLHVAETHVARARFPVIDFHTHVSWRRRAQKPAVPAGGTA